MRGTNAEKTKYLFRAIGGIDDRFLQEALCYRALRRSTVSRVMTLAACLSLVLALSVGAFLLTNRRDSVGPDDAPPAAEVPAGAALDRLLLDQRDTVSHTTLSSPEELDLFSGQARVVWQYADSSEICVSRALTEREVATLRAHLGNGTSVGDASPSLSCSVWIALGDGTVVTPYLKSSAGNTGTELFDYNAEILPTQGFISCISEILA